MQEVADAGQLLLQGLDVPLVVLVTLKGLAGRGIESSDGKVELLLHLLHLAFVTAAQLLQVLAADGHVVLQCLVGARMGCEGEAGMDTQGYTKDHQPTHDNK